MNAYQLHGCKDLRPVVLKEPRPGTGEVQVRVGRVGEFVVKQPFVLGHECAGEISEIGEGVCGRSIPLLTLV
jgi:NADPH:quinone reductase-like Zn-dependent oxidoreductase